MLAPSRTVIRREAGIYALERALQRRGFRHVAGADEAGRGACAGPLVAGAAILPEGKRGEIDELADSKLLTPLARERVYDEVVKRALAWSVVIIPPAEVDQRGLHVCNLVAMRRALASLSTGPEYVLTDGFPVDGLGAPGLAVWKGDRVAACVAAASVLAKVTRDRLMVELDDRFPDYGFAEHKGYITDEHSAALTRHGPCIEHRFSYVNVAAVSGRSNRPPRARRPAVSAVAGVLPLPLPSPLDCSPLDSPPLPPSDLHLSSPALFMSPADPPAPPALPAAWGGPTSPAASDEALMLRLRAEGTVGVASGEQLRPPVPVGEDGAMEGEEG
jgi:ribonuclease HII